MTEETQGYLGLPYTPGSDTSYAAAEQAIPNAARTRRLVLTLLRSTEHGLTHEELAQAAGDQYADSGLRTRCNELVKAGLVIDSGLRRQTRHGRSTVVWITRTVAASPGIDDPPRS
jgi:hypothetical protein